MADVASSTRAGGSPSGARRAVVQVRNATRGTILAGEALVADSRRARMVGLIGHESLPHGSGLILSRTPWVHTAFMAFPIDVVFYSHGGYVLLVIEHLAPWRVSPICWRAYAALELPAGTAVASDTRAGHLLRIDSADVQETAICASAARPADGH